MLGIQCLSLAMAIGTWMEEPGDTPEGVISDHKGSGEMVLALHIQLGVLPFILMCPHSPF